MEEALKAQHCLNELVGSGVTEADVAALLPLLLNALHAAPDPDRALAALDRWLAAAETPRDYLPLLMQPDVLNRFCLVTGSSQYFADLLVRNPDDFRVLVHPERYGERETPARRYLEISRLTEGCDTPEQQRDVLRTWKTREMLQIGVRDLLGLDDMPTVAREFSNLADACVQMALEIAYASIGVRGQGSGVREEEEKKRRKEEEKTAGQGTGNREQGTEGIQSAISNRQSAISSSFILHPSSLPAPLNLLTVFALGKHGGQELNYSSDIDLIFVHADGLPAQVVLEDGRRMETPVYLAKLAQTLINILSEDNGYGNVFRVDMRLRPEGRYGALSRSLTGYRVYYEKWAENWERQALLKARFVAGNRALGDAFMAMIAPFVYRRQISSAFLNDIRVNKRRIEQTCAKKGETDTNIKTGWGGIRDIEFIAQLLQLEFGFAHPRLRTPNTLTALQRLNEASFLTDRQAEELEDDYKWLRTLEHRLQLLHNAQTQTLPDESNTIERAYLSRRMGCADLNEFETELKTRRTRVRGYLDTLFYDQERRFFPALPETVDPLWQDVGALIADLNTEEAQADLRAKLTTTGFQDVPNALRLLQLMRHSQEFQDAPPQFSERFQALAPYLLETVAHSPAPDAALAGIESLAVPYRDPLYMLFQGRPDILWRLVRLACVPTLINSLAKHQEWLYPLLNEDETIPEVLRDTAGEEETGTQFSAHYVQALTARVGKLHSPDARWKMIALFYQRERLRIGARDIWDEADVSDVMKRLTRLAESTLQILLTLCIEARATTHPRPQWARSVLERVAVVGLGRLGSAELSYSSDWDLLFVYETERPRSEEAQAGERNALASGLVQDVLAAIKALNLHGTGIEADLRLRPWGSKGNLIYTLRGYLDYFHAHAETWERQAALKARFIAGNPTIGRRLERILRGVSVGRGITPKEDAAIHAMKTRIETERLKSQERATDLKLGHGGLSDIEWLAQLLQLRHGPQHPNVRVASTLRALDALETIHALDRSEVHVLTSAYRLLTRVRNRMTLLAGTPQDVFPIDLHRRRVLARLLGYEDSLVVRAEQMLQEDVQADMHEVRRIFTRRFGTDLTTGNTGDTGRQGEEQG